ncbi:hypothetical protein AX14_002480 [Amanita brunnescens Koide BX004]|nr:hypothetical protein AX14_002480 [Amanita brunnescens Koide BX004]
MGPLTKGPGIDTFVGEFDRNNLLEIMDRYWISQGSSNNALWAHEFSSDVVDFFEALVRVFRRYPMFDILASISYTLAQLEIAVLSQTRAVPYFSGVSNGTVWCHDRSNIVHTNQSTITNSSRSAERLMWYYERAAGSERRVDSE